MERRLRDRDPGEDGAAAWDPRAALRAAVFLVNRGLKDKVFAVSAAIRWVCSICCCADCSVFFWLQLKRCALSRQLLVNETTGVEQSSLICHSLHHKLKAAWLCFVSGVQGGVELAPDDTDGVCLSQQVSDASFKTGVKSQARTNLPPPQLLVVKNSLWWSHLLAPLKTSPAPFSGSRDRTRLTLWTRRCRT